MKEPAVLVCPFCDAVLVKKTHYGYETVFDCPTNHYRVAYTSDSDKSLNLYYIGYYLNNFKLINLISIKKMQTVTYDRTIFVPMFSTHNLSLQQLEDLIEKILLVN